MLKMIHCKEASELLSKQLDIELGFWEKWNLKFHVMMCSKCKAFSKQIEMVSRILKNHTHLENPHISLSPEAKAVMQEQIDQAASSR